ncbi:MAG TPA: sigma-54-dependent Fis family transcriptional regulator, partial [Cupriavidus sp.]|nr:sigma-54-dependent Fis family transcriptional regulator [Cupriavidus sp.]
MPFTHYGTLVPRISDEPVVASAWERFLRDHPHHPHEGDGVRRVVLASWQRCRSEAVDPTLHSAPGAADDRLRQLRTQNRDL